MYHIAQTRKRVRKLSTALFRGLCSQYSFNGFPITAPIGDVAAVFVISRRKIDRSGGAHHAVSCIGETDSMQAELKKHKRATCVKRNGANVVCLLKEADKAARMAVAADIASARTFKCRAGARSTKRRNVGKLRDRTSGEKRAKTGVAKPRAVGKSSQRAKAII